MSVVPVASTRSGTIRVDRRGRLVVVVRNAAAKTLRIHVSARVRIGGRSVTLATRTVSVDAHHGATVAFTIGAQMRKRLGHTTHPLTIVATPLSGANRAAATLATRIGAAT